MRNDLMCSRASGVLTASLKMNFSTSVVNDGGGEERVITGRSVLKLFSLVVLDGEEESRAPERSALRLFSFVLTETSEVTTSVLLCRERAVLLLVFFQQ